MPRGFGKKLQMKRGWHKGQVQEQHASSSMERQRM
jgi:hypothetical protein